MGLRDRRDIRRQIARLEKRLPADEPDIGVASDDAAAESLHARHPETLLVMITGVPEASPCDTTIEHDDAIEHDDPAPDLDRHRWQPDVLAPVGDPNLRRGHVTLADLKRRSATGFAVPMIDPLASY